MSHSNLTYPLVWWLERLLLGNHTHTLTACPFAPLAPQVSYYGHGHPFSSSRAHNMVSWAHLGFEGACEGEGRGLAG